MASRSPSRHRRRHLLPVFLALALAVQASGSAFAVRGAASADVGPSAAPGAFAGAPARSGVGVRSLDVEPVVDWARRPEPVVDRGLAARASAVRATPSAVATTVSVAPAASAAYRGTNHVWIPSLGINRAVEFFPCARTKPPGHQLYRWGCAGANNVYLMAHAATVFKPLHDAYVNGRLRVGMEAIYADGNGRVTRYTVSYWKVVKPDGDVGWAFAAQSTPSMTLQTCVGADSAYRLVVRLVKKG
jgi:hypothetical protein